MGVSLSKPDAPTRERDLSAAPAHLSDNHLGELREQFGYDGYPKLRALMNTPPTLELPSIGLRAWVFPMSEVNADCLVAMDD